jgi:hypothetical protein
MGDQLRFLGKSHRYPMNIDTGWTAKPVWTLRKKYLLPLPEIEP